MPHDDTEFQDIADDEESADLGLYEHAPVFEIMREPFIHGSGILPLLYLLFMNVFFSICIVINCLCCFYAKCAFVSLFYQFI